jgi:hypothetical protein
MGQRSPYTGHLDILQSLRPVRSHLTDERSNGAATSAIPGGQRPSAGLADQDLTRREPRAVLGACSETAVDCEVGMGDAGGMYVESIKMMEFPHRPSGIQFCSPCGSVEQRESGLRRKPGRGVVG